MQTQNMLGAGVGEAPRDHNNSPMPSKEAQTESRENGVSSFKDIVEGEENKTSFDQPAEDHPAKESTIADKEALQDASALQQIQEVKHPALLKFMGSDPSTTVATSSSIELGSTEEADIHVSAKQSVVALSSSAEVQNALPASSQSQLELSPHPDAKTGTAEAKSQDIQAAPILNMEKKQVHQDGSDQIRSSVSESLLAASGKSKEIIATPTVERPHAFGSQPASTSTSAQHAAQSATSQASRSVESKPQINAAKTSNQEAAKLVLGDVRGDVSKAMPLERHSNVRSHETEQAPNVATTSKSSKGTVEQSITSSSLSLDTPTAVEAKSSKFFGETAESQDQIQSPKLPSASDTNRQMFATALSAIAVSEVANHPAISEVSGEFSDKLEALDFRSDSTVTSLTRSASQLAMSPVLDRTHLPAHLAGQLAEAAKVLPNRPVELHLSPEELGKVKLTFQVSDTGAMTVVIQAEKADTNDLLRRNIHLLSEEFSSLGYEGSQFEFKGNDGGGDNDFHDQEHSEDARVSSTSSIADSGERAPQPMRLAVTGDARVDLRL